MRRITFFRIQLSICLSFALLPAKAQANAMQLPSDTVQSKKPNKTVMIQEVVVSDGQQRHFNSTFAGRDLLTAKDIQGIPTLLGEADVMRAIRLLPGIQSVSEGNSGVYVRGGSAGQNLFMLDEMELLNPSHLMGVFSVFNPLTTGRVDIYKGNAPVNMQGRLSSTIDVHSIVPNVENEGFEINIGTISSSIAMIKRSHDGKFDVVLGYRRCYLNLLGWGASIFLSDSVNYFHDNKYTFDDFNGKINVHLSEKTTLSLAWYTGKDLFSSNNRKVQYKGKTDWGNQSAILLLRHVPDNLNAFKSSIIYNSTFSSFNGELIAYDMQFSSFFEQIQQKNQWEHRWNNHLIHTGLDFFGQQALPVRMSMNYSADTVHQHEAFKNIGFSAYIGDYYCFPSNKLQLYAGLRTTVDAPIYSKNENNTRYSISKTWYSLSPVISISLFPKKGHSIKTSFSANGQNLHLAALSSIPLPNDIWTTSSSGLHPETSDQLTLGYYKIGTLFDFSVEAYGKNMKNQLLYNLNTDNSVKMKFEDQFLKGKGRAYGIDFSIQKKTGIFTGSLKYSYAKSLRSYPMIMDGKWFNDKNDRPHDLSLSVGYELNNKWDFSALWVLASGSNMTLPSGRWWMMGQIMNDYDNYNSFRLPAYHRLDLSVNRHLASRHFKESILNFSLINVYNRANPYYAYFKVYMDKNRYNLDIKSYQTSLFPFMPSISWKIKI